MSTRKFTILSLSTLFLILFLQISNAGEKAEGGANNTQYDSIVNIVDPALIAGTEVLLKDLL
ncbi:MAG: hypothetical protein KAG34_09465 [Cocleimonas sp.]|nr:hypothetical protein [Cocleimonas sp.]